MYTMSSRVGHKTRRCMETCSESGIKKLIYRLANKVFAKPSVAAPVNFRGHFSWKRIIPRSDPQISGRICLDHPNVHTVLVLYSLLAVFFVWSLFRRLHCSPLRKKSHANHHFQCSILFGWIKSIQFQVLKWLKVELYA